MQKAIPAMWMRGGTSKGLYLDQRDLPASPELRDAVLLAAMGPRLASFHQLPDDLLRGPIRHLRKHRHGPIVAQHLTDGTDFFSDGDFGLGETDSESRRSRNLVGYRCQSAPSRVAHESKPGHVQ